MTIKDVQFRSVGVGNFKAEATVTWEEFRISGFKVLEGEGGELWVGFPSRAYKKKDGSTAYQAIVWIEDPGRRKAVQQAILAAWARRGQEAGGERSPGGESGNGLNRVAEAVPF